VLTLKNPQYFLPLNSINSGKSFSYYDEPLFGSLGYYGRNRDRTGAKPPGGAC
jgi:hypothetical protein